MKIPLIIKILKLTVLTRALTFKKGALIILSTPVTISITEIFKSLFKDMQPNDLYLPVVIIALCLIVFTVCFMVDFAFGIVASKHERKGDADWFESSVAYGSIGKLGGVLLVNFIIMIIILFLILVEANVLSNSVLTILILINVVACSYEIHSIGENIERRAGEEA